MMEVLNNRAIALLEELIRTPSISRSESDTANIIQDLLRTEGHTVNRIENNIWVHIFRGENYPTLLLNSHHDTVKPVSGWHTDPYMPVWSENRLTGLGSNDAGASLVSLLSVFLYFAEREIPWNLVFLASAEEEISGKMGVELALGQLPAIDFGIVGEPTGMEMAIAEKGLCVVDGVATGVSGHAARNEGTNALYLAMEDIQMIRDFRFTKVSELLGPVKVTVTQIDAGTQHNVVPDKCNFVLDIRTNEHYSNKEVVDALQSVVSSQLTARSYRLNSSGLAPDHPAVMRAAELRLRTFGSPTLSDQALMTFPTIKMGPGDSARSHTAGEYILKEEISDAIEGYIKFIEGFKLK